MAGTLVSQIAPLQKIETEYNALPDGEIVKNSEMIISIHEQSTL